MKFKFTTGLSWTPQHPQARLGYQRGVSTIEVRNVPPDVPMTEVTRVLNGTAIVGWLKGTYTYDWSDLGIGRIVRGD